MALRGSKLDAAKQAEYVAETAAASDWDVSEWTRWTVIGRVVPERCNVNVPELNSHGAYASGRVRITFSVNNSEIAAKCAIECPNPSIFEIADLVRTALATPVYHLAFLNRGAYDVVLDTCLDDRTGKLVDVPIFEPLFGELQEGMSFDPGEINSGPIFPYKAASSPEVSTALGDLRNAIQTPRRTFEHCRMAIEVIRSHFDPKTIKNSQERQIAGEKALSTCLRIDREVLTQLDAVAARSRHGELVYAIDFERRQQALELAWEVVARFIAHLEGVPSDNWKIYNKGVKI
jgi:hypothetical protein